MSRGRCPENAAGAGFLVVSHFARSSQRSMAEQTDLRRLLVLNGPALEARGILSFLREHFDIRAVEEMDDALSAMREGHFDAVLAETADFLPLERGIVTQQAGVVLDTIGDGVCIVGSGGELAWANRRLREYPPGVVEPLRDICVRAYEEFASAIRKDPDRGRRFSLMPTGGSYYEVICSPVRDSHGVLRQVVAVVIDATSQRRQQLKLNAIDRAGHELVNLERDAMAERNAAERLRLLEERIIHCSRDVLNYQHFAMLLLDEMTNRLEMMVSEGLSDAGPYELFCSPEGNGICGYVAATGRSYICGDVRRDPRYLPGLGDARSSLTVPLRLNDKVIGVLNVESDAAGAFNEEDRQFAEIFANHIALALNILNLLVVERHTTHHQITGSVSAELAGPLNDVISEASEILEDYIGHDDLRNRLRRLIDRACEARKAVQELSAAGRKGVIGCAAASEPDPVLRGRRVLVADDEELIRETLCDVLRQCGCVVDEACDGTCAMALLAQTRYDLVVSDIKMPGATGYEVFSAARAACDATRVILMTAFGYDPNHSIVRANQEGLSAVLLKPFKASQLLDQCREALAKA